VPAGPADDLGEVMEADRQARQAARSRILALAA